MNRPQVTIGVTGIAIWATLIHVGNLGFRDKYFPNRSELICPPPISIFFLPVWLPNICDHTCQVPRSWTLGPFATDPEPWAPRSQEYQAGLSPSFSVCSNASWTLSSYCPRQPNASHHVWPLSHFFCLAIFAKQKKLETVLEKWLEKFSQFFLLYIPG